MAQVWATLVLVSQLNKTVGGWAEGSWFKNRVQTKTGTVTPSQHCRATLEQGTESPNAEGTCLGQPAHTITSRSMHVPV